MHFLNQMMEFVHNDSKSVFPHQDSTLVSMESKSSEVLSFQLQSQSFKHDRLFSVCNSNKTHVNTKKQKNSILTNDTFYSSFENGISFNLGKYV